MKTLQDLYDFFAGIPNSQWCILSRTGVDEDDDRRCALGHLAAHLYGSPSARVTEDLQRLGIDEVTLMNVNDGVCGHSTRNPTPKTRVLEFLATMKGTLQ
jgi:hypothetical protein